MSNEELDEIYDVLKQLEAGGLIVVDEETFVIPDAKLRERFDSLVKKAKRYFEKDAEEEKSDRKVERK